MYAIFQTGGKQYKVSEGDIIYVEKLDITMGEVVDFSDVLFIHADKALFGTPLVDNAKVTAEILDHGKEKKKIILRYRRKKDSRRKQGHRQPFTKLKITSISHS